MFRLAACCVVVVGAWVAGVANGQPPDKSQKKGDAVAADVRLLDGSAIRMTVLQKDIEIKTDYGMLTVPIKDVVKIEFGVHLPDGMEATIAKAIETLANENYKLREGALKELIDCGPYAYPQLHQAAKSDVAEVAKRATTAIEKIRAKHGTDNLRLKQDDVIVTTKFTIVGRITTAKVQAKNETIGELNMDLAKLRSIRWLVAGVESEVTIDAAKYGSNNLQWMDTSFEVQAGTPLVVTASGSVDLRPGFAGKANYTCTPNGKNIGGGFAGPGGGGIPFENRPGCLIGRIGESGMPFVVGEKYEGSPAQNGKLYLMIVPSPYGMDSSGSYKVKVAPGGE